MLGRGRMDTGRERLTTASSLSQFSATTNCKGEREKEDAVVNLSLPVFIIPLSNIQLFRRPVPGSWKSVPLHAQNDDWSVKRRISRIKDYEKARLRAAAMKKKKELLTSLKKVKRKLFETTILTEKGKPGPDGWPGARAGEARVSSMVKRQREMALETARFLSEEVKRIEALIDVQYQIIQDGKMP